MGPTGPIGLTGAAGATGLTGAAGPAGAKGDTGDTGAAGAKGDTGATGLQGPKGDPGVDGTDGATGATGPQGPAGPAGGVVVPVVKSSNSGAVVDLVNSTSTVTVTCDPGYAAVGGGVKVKDFTQDAIAQNSPDVTAGTATGWIGSVWSGNATNDPPTVYVLCVPNPV
jgi:hypothetical protein